MLVLLLLVVLVLLAPRVLVYLVGPLVLLVIGFRRWPGLLRGWKLVAAITLWVVVVGADLALRNALLDAALLGVLFVAEICCFGWLAYRRPAGEKQSAAFVLLGIAALVVGYLVYLNVGPAVLFQAASVRCGHEPVVGFDDIGFLGPSRVYRVPGDSGYGPSTTATGYFCSSEDAEAADYHRND